MEATRTALDDAGRNVVATHPKRLSLLTARLHASALRHLQHRAVHEPHAVPLYVAPLAARLLHDVLHDVLHLQPWPRTSQPRHL